MNPDKKCERCNSDLHVVAVDVSTVTVECHTCFATYDHEDYFYNPLTDTNFHLSDQMLQSYENSLSSHF